MKRENPYTPGVAGPPPVLAGRDEELEQFDELSTRLAEGRRIHQETILYGPRGNGKTTLLHKFTERLEMSSKVKPVFVQAPIIRTPDRLLRKLLGESPPSQQMETTRVRGNLGALETSVGGALETSEMTETTPEDREERCIAAMNDEPVLLMVDEAQRITGETLAAILSLTDAARRGKTKFAVVFSGTPGLPEHLKRQDATYLERARSIRMERLDEESTRTALFQPFEDAGYTNRLNASDESRLIEQTQHYPHFIQCAGYAIWDVAEDTDNREIDALTLTAAEPAWEKEMTSMYAALYRELSKNLLEPYAEAIALAFQEEKVLDVTDIRKIIADVDPDVNPQQPIVRLEDLGYIWWAEGKGNLYEPGIPSLMGHVLEIAHDRESA